MKYLLILLLCVIPALAQPYATHVVLSSQTGVTSDKVTIAQNQTVPALIQFTDTVILSTVDGTVKVEHSGVAPTTTAVVPSSTTPGGPTARSTGYTASNVGAGTQISVLYKLTANVPLTLDLRNIATAGTGTTRNVTVVVALGSSGNVQTAVYFKESY